MRLSAPIYFPFCFAVRNRRGTVHVPSLRGSLCVDVVRMRCSALCRMGKSAVSGAVVVASACGLCRAQDVKRHRPARPSYVIPSPGEMSFCLASCASLAWRRWRAQSSPKPKFYSQLIVRGDACGRGTQVSQSPGRSTDRVQTCNTKQEFISWQSNGGGSQSGGESILFPRVKLRTNKGITSQLMNLCLLLKTGVEMSLPLSIPSHNVGSQTMTCQRRCHVLRTTAGSR